MKKGPTINDVAREAGVVRSTVSHVINGSRTVRPETRAAVLAAVEKLNYRPSSAARELSRGKSMTIGTIVKDITSPYHAAITRGIQRGLNDRSYRSIIASVASVEESKPVLDVIMDSNVESIIVLSEYLDEQELLELAEQIPVVPVSRSIPDLANQSISIDNFKGGYEATRHLLTLGHQRIAHITADANDQGVILRRNGYLRALQDAGITPDPALIIEGGWQESDGYHCAQALLSRGTDFTAVFAGSDFTAYGAMLAFYEHNIKVPDQVSIVGFDDVLYSAFSLPPLTTIRQPMDEMGIAAAQMAIRLINNEPVEPLVLPLSLIIRASTRRIDR